MPNRLFAFFTIFVVPVGSLVGQQTCKPADIPVGVMSVKADPFRGLAPEDFIAQLQHKQVSLKSLTFDDGPRRILLVVDASKKLSADTRKAEVMMIEAMLSAAPPEDSFALFSARGPGREVLDFTNDRRAITQAIGDTGKQEGKAPGVLDAVMAGIERFGAPQTGDAIVVIAAELEGNHKANPKMVAQALREHHIRMFGLALGPVQTKNVVSGGTMTSTTSQGLAWTTPLMDTVYDTGDGNFFPLTVNSGGLVLGAMNGDSRRSYNMSDARLAQEVQQKARAVSKMIAAFYRLQLDGPLLSHAEDWTLDLNEAMRKQLQQVFLLYPHALGPC